MKRITSLAAVALGFFILTGISKAQTISIQFQGQGTPLLPADVAGVDAVSNWNVLTGSTFSSPVALTDNSGLATTATLAGAANGTYFAANGFAGGSGDQKLLSGELYNNLYGSEFNNGNSFTISSIPYAIYNVIIYGECDASDRINTFGLTPSEGVTQFLSFTTTNNAASYIQGTSTYEGDSPNNPAGAGNVPVGNYVEFTGLSGDSFNLMFGSTSSNTAINGIQIVNVATVPERQVARS